MGQHTHKARSMEHEGVAKGSYEEGVVGLDGHDLRVVHSRVLVLHCGDPEDSDVEARIPKKPVAG